MKHVVLNRYHKERRRFVVYLGNGTCHSFAQERQAQKFLVATSKFLTRSLYDLRYIFGQVNALYIRNWAYYQHNKASMSKKHVADELFCKEAIRDVEDAFDLIIERCTYTNGNYFAFQKQHVIERRLKDVILRMDQLHKSKSNAVDRFEFDALFDRLTNVGVQLDNYCQRDATELFTLPLHIGDDSREFIPELRNIA